MMSMLGKRLAMMWLKTYFDLHSVPPSSVSQYAKALAKESVNCTPVVLAVLHCFNPCQPSSDAPQLWQGTHSRHRTCICSCSAPI
jgi:hypothetical protein